MTKVLGIRTEDKNQWERRVPLNPEQVQQLIQGGSIEVIIQPSQIRVYPDKSYQDAGAIVQEDLSECSVVIAIKEIPTNLLEKHKTYAFFSHTIKGQEHNMPMLERMMELKCNLIDYERIVDDQDRRLIFFGHQAGWAGMINSLWALGRRLGWEGIENPFSEIQQAIEYDGLKAAKDAINKVGTRIAQEGLPQSLCPMVFGITGYGNVSKGAQDILECLPLEQIDPSMHISALEDPSAWKNKVAMVVFKEEHMFRPISPGNEFELQDYYDNPDRYESKFESFIPSLMVLVNCIYWDKMYPRLLTKEYLHRTYNEKTSLKLRIIGDISCDIEGAMECTVKCTDTGSPLFVYDPITDQTFDGVEGRGVVVLAVDNLPAELPAESSTSFGNILLGYIPPIIETDFSKDFHTLGLPPEIMRALILHKGELTSEYTYMSKFLK